MRPVIFGSAGRLKPKKETMINGQRDFAAANSVFTVPTGVYSVNIALVASGQNATAFKSGDGGNLRYQNDIPVIPGQTYTVVCGSNGGLSSALGLTSNTPLSATVKGANGSAGRTVGTPGISQGGSAGGGGGVTGSGINLTTWTYVPAAASASSGGVAGGGGGVYRNANSNLNQQYSGASGAVRIIWGPDRGFPNKKIGNL